ncbi:MAG: hypothetical protein ACYCUM_03165 [Solirubrobacteraceae bacterium]
MSGTTPALLVAAAGVGLGHAILPDHWLPLAVVGRTRRYPLARVARLALFAGVAHVLVSILLGAAVIAVGLQFRSLLQSAQDAIVGGILIATGLGFATVQLTGRGHRHRHDGGHGHTHHRHHHTDASGAGGHDHAQRCDRRHEHGHEERHVEQAQATGDSPTATDVASDAASDAASDPLAPRGLEGLAAVMVPFGAAASPDLTILPVFLVATTAGVAPAVGSLLIFAAVTIGTIVGLTLLACLSGYRVRGDWLDRWSNALTATTLIAIGTLIVSHVI